MFGARPGGGLWWDSRLCHRIMAVCHGWDFDFDIKGLHADSFVFPLEFLQILTWKHDGLSTRNCVHHYMTDHTSVGMETLKSLIDEWRTEGLAEDRKLQLLHETFDLTSKLESGNDLISADLGFLSMLRCAAELNAVELKVVALRTVSVVISLVENLLALVSPEVGIMPVLIASLQSKSGEARYWALKCILDLSIESDNKIAFGSPDLGLTTALVQIVRLGSVKAKPKALGILHNLASEKMNRVYMGSQDLDLLRVLTEVVVFDVDNKLIALRTLAHLAIAFENKTNMASPTLALLPRLIQSLQTDGFDAKMVLLDILSQLAMAVANRDSLNAESLGLKSTLTTLSQSENPELSSKAVTTLMHLSGEKVASAAESCADYSLLKAKVDEYQRLTTSVVDDRKLQLLQEIHDLASKAENQTILTTPDLGLLTVLKDTISSKLAKAKVLALRILSFVTPLKESKAMLASTEAGFLPLLISSIQVHSEARYWALKCLHHLSSDPVNKVAFGSPDLGLIASLIPVVRTGSVKAKPKALAILCNLSSEKTNRVYMGSRELDLLRLLTEIVEFDADNKVAALNTLMYLSVIEENKPYLVAQELNLLPRLVDLLVSQRPDTLLPSLQIVRYLSIAQDIRLLLASPELKLLPGLVSIVSSFGVAKNDAVLTQALATLQNLAALKANRSVLAATSLGLLPHLCTVLQSTNDAVDIHRMHALSIVHHLAMDADARTTLLSPELSLLPTLESLTAHRSEDVREKATSVWQLMSRHAKAAGLTTGSSLSTKSSGSSDTADDAAPPLTNEDLVRIRSLLTQSSMLNTQLNKVTMTLNAHSRVLDQLVSQTCACPKLIWMYPKQPQWRDWLSDPVSCLLSRSMMLVFVCPVTLKVVQGCGPQGVGWEVKQPRDWVRKWGPALVWSLRAMQAAVVAGRVLGIPLPRMPSPEELGVDLAKLNRAALRAFNELGNGLHDLGVDTSCLLEPTDISDDINAINNNLRQGSIAMTSLKPSSSSTRYLEARGDAYDSLVTFLTTGDNLQLGPLDRQLSGKMERVHSAVDGAVEWVSVEAKETWYALHAQSPRPPPSSTQRAGAPNSKVAK